MATGRITAVFEIGGTITIASGSEPRRNPDAAYNLARNEYLVVYDRENAASGKDIWHQRLTGLGVLLGGGEVAVAGWPDHEWMPAVAACHSTDNYLVTWQSEAAAGTDHDVYARFLDGDGLVDGGPISIAYYDRLDEFAEVTCGPGAEGFQVVYQVQYGVGNYGILTSMVWNPSTVEPATSIQEPLPGLDRTRPAVAATGNGTSLVVWEHDRSGAAYTDIHGRTASLHLFADGFESGTLAAWSDSTP